MTAVIQSRYARPHIRIASGPAFDVARKRSRASEAYCFQSTGVLPEGTAGGVAIAHSPDLWDRRSNSTLARPVRAITLLPTRETRHVRVETPRDHHRCRRRRHVGRAPVARGRLPRPRL